MNQLLPWLAGDACILVAQKRVPSKRPQLVRPPTPPETDTLEGVVTSPESTTTVEGPLRPPQYTATSRGRGRYAGNADAVLKRADAQNRRRATILTNTLLLQPAPVAVDRLVLGAGANATTLACYLDPKGFEFELGKLPSVIFVGRQDQWSKEGAAPMGQVPWGLEIPQFTCQVRDFMDETSAEDPHFYTPSVLFNQAMRVTQADISMPIVWGLAGPVEPRAAQDDWQRPDLPYRVPVQCLVKGRTYQRYVYAENVDITIGLGPARKPAPEVAPRALEHVGPQGFSPIIYGHDFVGSHAAKGRRVLVYGGGARSAGSVEYAEANEMDVVHWLAWEDISQAKAAGRWGASVAERYENNGQVTEEQDLKSVSQQPDGSLLVTFSDRDNGAETVFVCDQIVIAIGTNTRADPRVLIEHLGDMDPIYQYEGTQPIRVLGTQTGDGKVRMLGATGTLGYGLSRSDRDRYRHLGNREVEGHPSEWRAPASLFVCTRRIGRLYGFSKDSWGVCLDINNALLTELQGFCAGDATLGTLIFEEKKSRHSGFRDGDDFREWLGAHEALWRKALQQAAESGDLGLVQKIPQLQAWIEQESATPINELDSDSLKDLSALLEERMAQIRFSIWRAFFPYGYLGLPQAHLDRVRQSTIDTLMPTSGLL